MKVNSSQVISCREASSPVIPRQSISRHDLFCLDMACAVPFHAVSRQALSRPDTSCEIDAMRRAPFWCSTKNGVDSTPMNIAIRLAPVCLSHIHQPSVCRAERLRGVKPDQTIRDRGRQVWRSSGSDIGAPRVPQHVRTIKALDIFRWP